MVPQLRRCPGARQNLGSSSMMMDKIEEGRSIEYYQRKRDQHWEMAGLARQDGDHKDEERHMNLAREYSRIIRELSA